MCVAFSKLAQSITMFHKTYGIIDPWRFKYPSSKQFSFFPPVHRTYSRIDYFLIDQKLLSMVMQVDYHSIIISHHSPVTKFNPRLLSELKFTDFNTQIDIFIELNESVTPPV